METKDKITLEKARQQIEKAIDQNGPFSHNIAGLVLSQVASEHGVSVANDLIDEFDLTDLYGIHPVTEEAKPEPVVEKVVEKVEPVKKETPYERRRKESNAKLASLYQQLVALPQDPDRPVVYEIVTNAGYNQSETELRVKVFGDDHPAYCKKIRVFTALKGNGYYSHSDYKIFVRIDTDDWNTSFKKNWTFETKDLATKVHTKVQEFYTALQYKYTRSVEDKDSQKTVEAFLNKKFSVTGESVYAYPGRGTVYTKAGKVEYRASSETPFSIELSGLTEDQLDRIIAIKLEKSND